MLKAIIKNIFNELGYEVTSKKGFPQAYYEIDRRFHELYDHAQGKCQMAQTDNTLRRQRHYTLNYLLWNTNIEQGDVCELGCFRGLSAYQIASYIHSVNRDIIFHVFDSFEGLSEFSTNDILNEKNGNTDVRRKQFACSLETVKANLKDFNFVKYYKGWIPVRFAEVKDRQFSFVHVDVDLYQPIYDSFQFFYPKLIKHGVMVFDDYGETHFPGAKKAIDQCVAMFDNPFFLPLPSGQAFLIKD